METNKNYLLIQQYLSGVLDDKTMHELEKQALDDPFLADALEGYAQTEVPVGKQLSILQTQLQERIAEQQNTRNVLSFSWQRLSIAAAAGLLFITASILFWIKNDNKNRQIASNERQVEVNLKSTDSSKNAESSVLDIEQPVTTRPLKERDAQIKPSEPSDKNESIPSASKASTSPESTAGEPAKTASTSSLKAETLQEVQVARSSRVLKGKATGVILDSQPENISTSNNSLSRQAFSVNVNRSDVEPVIGWEEYKEYLKYNTNIKSSQSEGVVLISFVVNKNGSLSELKVEKSLNTSADREALRVVKDGPVWKRGQDSTGTVSVKFGIE